MSKVLTIIADRLARTKAGKSALGLAGTPDVFRRKPSPRIIVGLVLIAVSFVVGWPMVAVFGMLAAYLGEPLILIIGGPTTYGFAWLVWLAGMFCVGAKSYTVAKQYSSYLLKLFIERYQSQREKTSSETNSGSSSSSSSTKE
jgi:hypothetical protein